MFNFKENLLAQFSVVTFVIMVILALIVSIVLIEILNEYRDITSTRPITQEEVLDAKSTMIKGLPQTSRRWQARPPRRGIS